MRTLGALLMAVAVYLFYLSALDRQSPMALRVVEIETQLKYVQLYSIAGILGLLMWVPSVLGKLFKPPQRHTITQAGHRPAQRRARASAQGYDQGAGAQPPHSVLPPGHAPLAADPFGRAPTRPVPPSALGSPWRQEIMAQLRGYDGGTGARIVTDDAMGVPLVLVLEHLSPRHCERAIGALGDLLSWIPLPPRVRIRFDNCPEGPAPRHHLVGKALGAVLDPGVFKAVSTADQVDVMFLNPDPRWREEW